jgi:hypothetical protein
MTAGPREFDVELPIGYEDDDGQIHRRATIRKMTGRDEAVMADKRYRHNGARMITELLGNCLLRLGTLDRPGPVVTRKMYSADRHYLLVRLREITFGPEMKATYTCPTCREATTFLEDLTTLEVIRLGDGETPADVVVELDDGYLDRDGRCYTTLVFRQPTGTDEEKIAAVIRENTASGKNALLTRCLKKMGDMPAARLEALGSAVFNDMPLGDRKRVDSAVSGEGTGMRLKRTVLCNGCARTYDTSLDMSDFLAGS